MVNQSRIPSSNAFVRGHDVESQSFGGRLQPTQQPLRRKYGSANHPILVAKCALSRPADNVETHTPRHCKDAASRKIRLVAIESRSCFSLWKVNPKGS